MLPFIDILIGSKEFPHRVTGIRDERAALIELKTRYGCAITGMTIGTDGAIVYCEGQFIESRGLKLGRMQRHDRRGRCVQGRISSTDCCVATTSKRVCDLETLSRR